MKEGEWYPTGEDDWNTWECSVCHSVQQLMDGTPEDNEWFYCPHCGAKLVGDEE